MLKANRSYERERWPYAVDSKTTDQYTDWLKPIPWQLFCTFTFAWRVSDPQANKIFDEFINRLGRHYKCDIAYVRGDEKRLSGCGKPACGRHFHVLLTCAAPMSTEYVETLWMSMAGKRSDKAGAQVKIYDPNQNGVSYVLKFINRPDGDWDHKNLDLFLPLEPTVQVKKRMRRHLGRHLMRAQKFLHAKDPQPLHLDTALLELTNSTLRAER